MTRKSPNRAKWPINFYTGNIRISGLWKPAKFPHNLGHVRLKKAWRLAFK